MADCLFCKIRDGQVPASFVYRDDELLAFRDINPAAPTHVLLIPSEHVSSADALEERHAALAGKLVLRAAALARELGLVEGGYRLTMNNGAGAGQSVFHLHLHLLGGRRFSWPPG
ncbi:MAG TPA: histidine triad nucleotide-binding protein [Myxococcota bacterium]|jgi:histidine triad (HIT) family protein|nr:histidine triad nucleotide-binding protein [Myxococcota bacterium]